MIEDLKEEEQPSLLDSCLKASDPDTGRFPIAVS